jgi:hypothetical protein
MKLCLVTILCFAVASCEVSHAQVQNSNPNYAKIREYGHIEWLGSRAQLTAGGTRPLDMAAQTLSSCLGISVSVEDPHYAWLGDLLDVTAPQWIAQHPDQHAYAAKPGKVELSFEVRQDGEPKDTIKLLEDALDQINQQQPWHYRLQRDVRESHAFFTFVPTASHNQSGQLEEVNSWLDDRITIRSTTAPIMAIADTLAENLSSDTDSHFSCCQSEVIGHFWGSQTLPYEATAQTGRLILEDLMIAAGGGTSFVLRCEPMGQRCHINVVATVNRIPATAPKSGACTAVGYPPD